MTLGALAMVSAVLASAAPVGVSVATSSGVEAGRVAAVLAEFQDALRRAGLAPAELPSQCAGDRGCLQTLAQARKLSAFAALALVGSRRGLAVDIEVADAAGKALGQVTVALAPRDPPSRLRPDFDTLAAAVARQLPPPAPAPPPVADAPRVEPVPPTVPPVPTRVEPAPALTDTAPPPAPARSRAPTVAAILLGVGAAGTAGATIGLGVSGLDKQRRANATADGFVADLTRPRAQALVDSANADYTAALAMGLTTAALATAALVVGLAVQ